MDLYEVKRLIAPVLLVAVMGAACIWLLAATAEESRRGREQDCADIFAYVPTARDSMTVLLRHANCSDFIVVSPEKP